MSGRSIAVIGVVGMLAAGCGGGRTMGGSALLARVRAAYLHVPAVTTVNSYNNRPIVSHTYLLRRGRITDELFQLWNPVHEVEVGLGNGRAYGLTEAKCWVPAPNFWASAGDRGSRFPDLAPPNAGPPSFQTARQVGSVWQLPVTIGGSHDTMLIDAKTFLVTRLVFGKVGGRNAADYKTLKRAPTFPAPHPLCKPDRVP